MFFTKKKTVLRCLGTFIVSCVNPIAGAIVAAINIRETVKDHQTDEGIKEIMPLMEEYRKKGHFKSFMD